MLATLAALFAVAGLSGVQAQIAVYACDGTSFPDYDACDRVMASVPWDSGSAPGERTEVKDGTCELFFEPENVSNCIISACNSRGDGKSSPLNVFNGPTNYGLVKQWCKPDNTGGEAPTGSSNSIKAMNNPDFISSSRVKRAVVGKVTSKVMTIEESKAFEERAKQANIERLTPRGSQLDKRASWINLGVSKNIRKDDTRSRMSAVAGSGATQQWSTTEGFSTSVTTSAEMGVNLFEIFTASVSISVTQEHSVQYTETLTFDPSGRCDPNQDAVLYFYPLFDRYLGMFDDSDQEYTIWIPIEGANNNAIDVECLG